MNPPKEHNPSITLSKGTEVVEMPNKEFRSLIFKMSKDSNKWVDEVKKSVEELEEFNN
jgi:hypothetical protein